MSMGRQSGASHCVRERSSRRCCRLKGAEREDEEEEEEEEVGLFAVILLHACLPITILISVWARPTCESAGSPPTTDM